MEERLARIVAIGSGLTGLELEHVRAVAAQIGSGETACAAALTTMCGGEEPRGSETVPIR